MAVDLPPFWRWGDLINRAAGLPEHGGPPSPERTRTINALRPLLTGSESLHPRTLHNYSVAAAAVPLEHRSGMPLNAALRLAQSHKTVREAVIARLPDRPTVATVDEIKRRYLLDQPNARSAR